MLFSFDITIPVNTLESAPTEEQLKLSAGVITKIQVKFPAGCHGLVGIRLLHEENQIMPINRDDWVTGDNEDVPSDEYYDLGKTAKELTFLGISPNSLYEHTITVRITVLPREAASMIPFIEKLTSFLRRLGIAY